jgi:hypothetical protein
MIILMHRKTNSIKQVPNCLMAAQWVGAQQPDDIDDWMCFIPAGRDFYYMAKLISQDRPVCEVIEQISKDGKLPSYCN